MRKRGLFLIAGLVAAMAILSGCETTVGAGKGLAYGVYASGEGAVHDTCNTYDFMMSVDEWIKNNLW
jgi:predicted small secreted protein